MDPNDLRNQIRDGLTKMVQSEAHKEKFAMKVIHDCLIENMKVIGAFMHMVEGMPREVREAMLDAVDYDLEDMAINGYLTHVIIDMLRLHIDHGSVDPNDVSIFKDQVIHAIGEANDHFKQVYEKRTAEGRT